MNYKDKIFVGGTLIWLILSACAGCIMKTSWCMDIEAERNELCSSCEYCAAMDKGEIVKITSESEYKVSDNRVVTVSHKSSGCPEHGNRIKQLEGITLIRMLLPGFVLAVIWVIVINMIKDEE